MDQIEIANCERKKGLLQVTKPNTQESLECQTGSSEKWKSTHQESDQVHRWGDSWSAEKRNPEISKRSREIDQGFCKNATVWDRTRWSCEPTIQDPVNESSSLFLSIGPTKRRTKVVGRVRFLMFTCEMWESEPADRTDPKLGKRRRKQKCSRRLWVNGGFLYFRCIVSESVLPRLWSDPRGGGGRLPVSVSSFRPAHSPPPHHTHSTVFRNTHFVQGGGTSEGGPLTLEKRFFWVWKHGGFIVPRLPRGYWSLN